MMLEWKWRRNTGAQAQRTCCKIKIDTTTYPIDHPSIDKHKVYNHIRYIQSQTKPLKEHQQTCSPSTIHPASNPLLPYGPNPAFLSA